jgi:hypothetical protein
MADSMVPLKIIKYMKYNNIWKGLVQLSFAFFPIFNFAQIGINSNNTAPHPSAQLDVNSTNKGLLLPRITSPNSTISSPAAGLMVYDQSNANLAFYNGSSWSNINGSAANQGLYSQFPNSQYFSSLGAVFDGVGSNTLPFSWVKPSGINRIWVEMWSSGGGGQYFGTPVNNPSYYNGGHSGSYMSGILDISTIPGPIQMAVGKGGRGGASPSFSGLGGTNTTLSGNTNNILAQVGKAFFFLIDNKGLLSYVEGADGFATTFEFQTFYSGATASTVTFYKGGSGANAYLAKGGEGELVQTSPGTNNIATTNQYGNGANGAFPGAGGGTGYNTGGHGAGGLIIIHW